MSSAASKEPAYYKNEINDEEIKKLEKIFDTMEKDRKKVPRAVIRSSAPESSCFSQREPNLTRRSGLICTSVKYAPVK